MECAPKSVIDEIAGSGSSDEGGEEAEDEGREEGDGCEESEDVAGEVGHEKNVRL